jgi:hypothetical protein
MFCLSIACQRDSVIVPQSRPMPLAFLQKDRRYHDLDFSPAQREELLLEHQSHMEVCGRAMCASVADAGRCVLAAVQKLGAPPPPTASQPEAIAKHQRRGAAASTVVAAVSGPLP